MLAWRDLDDVEAGGSEVHAHNIASLWAQAGLEVMHRTSFAAGHPQHVRRNGYAVVRKAGRYMVFPRSVAAEIAGRNGHRDALVEIWNGVPVPVAAVVPRPSIACGSTTSTARCGRCRCPRVSPAPAASSRSGSRRRSTARPTSSRCRSRRETNSYRRWDSIRIESRWFRPASTSRSLREAGVDNVRRHVVAVGRLVPVKDFARLVRIMAAVRDAGARPPH